MPPSSTTRDRIGMPLHNSRFINVPQPYSCTAERSTAERCTAERKANHSRGAIGGEMGQPGCNRDVVVNHHDDTRMS